MLERLKKSDAENEDLKKKLVEYQNLENTLRRSLLIAEESNKELRRVAKNESIQMVEEARRNASRIVNDALIKAERIEANADALKRRAIMYKRKIKQLLDEQNQMLDKFDDIEY
ncbi:cell-division initiation protein (Septum placement) [Coprobacillus sp. CAG:605]|nr:cell-division initiation protein (Septum placement) [Coprobacillus sp. CAG:605]